MRVTQNMMNNRFLYNLNNNLGQMSKLQEQAATGQLINRPSDDPIGLTFSLRYRSEIAANDQYKSNVDMAMSQLENVDTTLGQANDIMAKIRELSVRGANSTNPPDAMTAIANEIKQLYSQLVEVGNKQFNGKYVFNGQLTDIKPYTDLTAGTVDVNTDPIKTEIGVGVKLTINTTGQDVFGSSTDPDNAFQTIQSIISLVEANNFDGVSGALATLDSRIAKVLQARTDAGAKFNRIELAHNRLEDMSLNLAALQAKVEDADMAEVYTNLEMAANVYNSSLSVGAKILRPSLVDFLN